jgi:replicative DNA helicase
MDILTLRKNDDIQESSIPYNLEAEQSLLGALLLNNQAYERVSDFLKMEHFSHQVHGQIYNAIITLIDSGKIADPITLKAYFSQSDDLISVGGARYLVDLSQSVISIVSVADYGKLIYEDFLRRELINIGEQIVVGARKPEIDKDAHYQIERAEKQLFDLATNGHNNSFATLGFALTEAITSAEKAFKRDSHVVGVTSGLYDLDRYLGGLHPSDLLILAGRPSMGKTALATNIAFNAASIFAEKNGDGAPVAFFSLEMSAEQLAARILSSESGIASDRIRRGDIKTEDFTKIVDVSRKLHSVPLYIDDTPGLSITAFRNRARRLKRQHNIGLIIVDYLQLLEGGGSKRSKENRVQEVSEITRSLKGVAKELNVPILALSQLSRSVETRDDKRPQLSDLRESGSIEQDADVVMFVYREEYYISRQQPPEGTEKYLEWQQKMNMVYNKAEVLIAKQRHGPVGTVRLYFNNMLTRFGNLQDDLMVNDHHT